MPDVRMPNGMVIHNVPEGTSKDALLQKLSTNGYDTNQLLAPAAPTPVPAARPTPAPAAPTQDQAAARYAQEHPILASVGEGLKGFGRGIVSGIDTAAQGLAEQAPTAAAAISDLFLPGSYRAAHALAEAKAKPVAESLKQGAQQDVKNLGLEAGPATKTSRAARYISKGSEMVGGFIPYVAADLLAPEAAIPAQLGLAVGQGTSASSDAIDAYEERTGKKVDPTTRQLVQLGGGSVGAITMLPAVRAITKTVAPEAAPALVDAVAKDVAAAGTEAASKPNVLLGIIKDNAAKLGSTAIGRTARAAALCTCSG